MSKPVREWIHRLVRSFDTAFEGSTGPLAYAVLRIGLSSLLLVRESDWLRPIVTMEHHRFVHGLDFTWSNPVPPYLVSPLSFGIALGETATNTLVYARTGLAVLLFLGVQSRLSAALLALVSYVLLASDRYHYYHHLHLLFVGIAWLSLCPLDDCLSLERRVRSLVTGGAGGARESPLWPLQLVRAFVLGVYFASGVAKANRDWLSGSVLEELHGMGAVSGSSWDLGERVLGANGVAVLTCFTELSLPLFLAWAPTRRAAVFAAWAFHVSIGSSMNVFTFGAEMAVLLVAFLPRTTRGPAPLARNAS